MFSEAAPYRRDQSVVVRSSAVEFVINMAEAWIETLLNSAAGPYTRRVKHRVADQISGREIYVGRVAGISGVASDYDQAGGVSSRISQAGRQIWSELTLQRRGPNLRIRNTQV